MLTWPVSSQLTELDDDGLVYSVLEGPRLLLGSLDFGRFLKVMVMEQTSTRQAPERGKHGHEKSGSMPIVDPP